MNFLKWVLNLLFGWIFKPENPYVKVLKERYLSLIVVPILIISIPLYYVKTLYNTIVDVPIAIYIFILIIKLLIRIFKRDFLEVFAQFIRLFVIAISIIIWWNYLSTSVERTIEHFEAKRDYYIRKAAERSANIKNGEYPLVVFNLKMDNPTIKRSIIYDKTDSYFNPKIIVDPSSERANNDFCNVVVKIEPHFYYSRNCNDHEVSNEFDYIEE